MVIVLISLLSSVSEKTVTCWPHCDISLPHLQDTESAYNPPSFSRLLEQAVPRTLHSIAVLKLRIKYRKAQLSYRLTSFSAQGKDLAAVNYEWSWNHITRVCLPTGSTKCAGHSADKTSKETWRGFSTHLLTYLLTPFCRVLLEKPTSFQLVKNFPSFYGTRRCITTFTNAATCPYPEPDRSNTCPHIPFS